MKDEQLRYRLLNCFIVVLLFALFSNGALEHWSNKKIGFKIGELQIGSVFAQSIQNTSVSVTVAPKTSDFQFSLTSTDGKTNVAQNEVLSYEITYGAYPSAGLNTTTTLVADFSDDLSPGNSHVLDYVPGSASNAYGGAVPVVDLINRKITWTIPSLPPGTTNQTVAFQLKTNSNYTGDGVVSFTTRASMSNQYITMPDETLTQTYQYDPLLVPTLTPTSTPNTASPTTTSNPLPTLPAGTTPSQPSITEPTGSVDLPKIISISFTNITSSGATISVETSVPSISTIFYGTSPNSLLQKVQGGDYALLDKITLTNLKSNTVYYFRITSVDKNGNTVTSEIYTFQTAKESGETFFIEEGAVSIESMGTKVLSKLVDKNSSPGFAFLIDNTDFTLSYTPKNPVKYKSFDVVIKSKNSYDKIVNLQENDLKYIANLKTGSPGEYEIFLKAQDENGNLTEQKVADLNVGPRLAVFEKGSNKPIGDARVFFYYFNTKTGKYEPILKEFFGNITNPYFTDANGKADILLPTGRYRVEVSAFLYDKQLKEFTIGPEAGEELPQIYLNRDPFNLVNITQFIRDWMSDLFNSLTEWMLSLNSSVRLFNLAALITGIISIITTLLFTFKTHMDPKKLPVFFMFGIHMVLNKHKKNYILGIIMDKENSPVSKARIELIDKETGEVITHTTSNKLGRFHFHKADSIHDVKLRIGKDGYKEEEVVLGNDMELKIILRSAEAKHNFDRIHGLKLIEHIGGSLFETSLIASIVLEFLFLSKFGLIRTLPFLILSLFNIMLWIFYMKEAERIS